MSSVSSVAAVTPYRQIKNEVQAGTGLPDNIASIVAAFTPASELAANGYEVEDRYWSERATDLTNEVQSAISAAVVKDRENRPDYDNKGAESKELHQEATRKINAWRSFLRHYNKNPQIKEILGKPPCDLSWSEIKTVSHAISLYRDIFLYNFFKKWAEWAEKEAEKRPVDKTILRKMGQIQDLSIQDQATSWREWLQNPLSPIHLHQLTALPFIDNGFVVPPIEILKLENLDDPTFTQLFKLCCERSSVEGIESVTSLPRFQNLDQRELVNALCSSCKWGHLEAVTTLLESGRGNELINRRTINYAYWIAKKYNRTNIVEYLERHLEYKQFIKSGPDWNMQQIAARVVFVVAIVIAIMSLNVFTEAAFQGIFAGRYLLLGLVTLYVGSVCGIFGFAPDPYLGQLRD